MHAAVALITEGNAPQVADVADRAGVSRTTAFRYFPTREVLLSEASARAAHAPLDDHQPIDSSGEALDPTESVTAAVRRVGAYTLQHQALLRTALRVSLDPDNAYRRPAQRNEWIDALLQPLQQQADPTALRRLRGALTLVFGIDPIVVLTDIAQLDPDEAIDVLTWTADTLVRAVAAHP